MYAFMIKLARSLVLVACMASLASAGLSPQESESTPFTQPILTTGAETERIPPPNYIPKRQGRYTQHDWATMIDETWGPGYPTEDKLAMFNNLYDTLTGTFACFQNLNIDDTDWFALGDAYRAEITSGVSRGRFAGILNHLTRRLMDGHTYCNYDPVSYTTLDPGVPLMWTGCWGEQDHFGACVTPTMDGDLVAYRVAPDHPLDLVPGDVILGYDGVPWSQLVPELMEAELPFAWVFNQGFRPRNGGCESAEQHSLQGAVGMNWHLFDEIDIRKYASQETVHLPTSLLVGQDMEVFANEQMPVDGIPFPDHPSEFITWGTIQRDGSEIGYIYITAWTVASGADFATAITELWDTDALIIDQRFNMGGHISTILPGCELLFDTTFEYMYGAYRCGDPNDLYSMCPSPLYPELTIHGDPDTYYDKPIAVLLGPGCVSMGDLMAFVLKNHPRARFFGRSSNMSTSSPTGLTDPPLRAYYAWENAFLPPRIWPPDEYLSHLEFEMDEYVWLTTDDVALGLDTVVEAAISWIVAPAVTVVTPNGGEYVAGLSEYAITWTSSDNVGVTETHVLLSTDGGASFPDTLASLTDETSYQWTVPDIDEPNCRVKVVCYDAVSNEGSDISDGDFRIIRSTSVDDLPLASGSRLLQNSPNPFSLNTNVRFTLPLRDHVMLRIYDCSGRLVRTMVNDVRPAGEYSLVWDGRNQQGRRVTSGLYHYELVTGGVSNVRRMILIR